MNTASQAWINCLGQLLVNEEITFLAGALGKATTTHEILNNTISVNMRYPLVAVKARELSYKYIASEALYTIMGANLLNFNDSIKATLSPWSDDGIFVNSAYGPKFTDQIPYIIKAFEQDIFTRRAVINIWREKPGESKDTPCLISLQFILRKNKFNCIATMRSSDAWLGLPNDISVFSYMADYVRLLLMGKALLPPGISIGTLYINTGSSHIYKENVEVAQAILRDPYVLATAPGQYNSSNELIEMLHRASEDKLGAFSILGGFENAADVESNNDGNSPSSSEKGNLPN